MISFKSYPSWFIFFITIMLGLSVIMSSNNWFMCWIGLELSLMGFIPMIAMNSLSLEGSVKYFLVQAGGSALLVLSFTTFYFSSLIYVVSMCLKMGMVPFHQWVPSVVSSLSFFNIVILLTIQKLPPLLMLMKSNAINFMVLSSILSILVGSLIGVNQTQMNNLLAYSSISHSGWNVIPICLSSEICLMYFGLYCLSILIFVIALSLSAHFKIFKLNMKTNNRLLMVILLLSLSGLPPFPLFFGKVLIALLMIQYNIKVTMLMVILSSLTIYFYTYNIIPAFSLSN